LLLHIAGGTVGLITGYAALAVGKGSRRHILLGIVFCIAMLIMATDGAFLALLKAQPGNVFGGLLTVYMISTAWMAARRRDPVSRWFDWVAMLMIIAVGIVLATFGVEAVHSATGMKYELPPGPYFFLGTIATLSAMGDIRLVARGRLTYTQRIVRHLWRMCFGLFIAAGSVFLARAHIFPTFIRKTGILWFLTAVPFLAMLFWAMKLKLANRRKTLPVRIAAEVRG
jgi:hypothetical protein